MLSYRCIRNFTRFIMVWDRSMNVDINLVDSARRRKYSNPFSGGHGEPGASPN